MDKPLYIQIRDLILESIDGKPANTPIASEREISAQYNASRMTVRKAVESLVEDGYLYRDKNKGTFVADSKLHKKSSTAVIYDESKADDLNYKILYFDIKQRSDEDVQKNLEIPFGESILRVVRLVQKEEVAISVEEIYVARKNITDDDLGNLKVFLELTKYIEQGSMSQVFIPMIVPVQYAQLLHIKINTPIIRIDNLIHKMNGQPFIFIKSFNNPSKNKIEITL